MAASEHKQFSVTVDRFPDAAREALEARSIAVEAVRPLTDGVEVVLRPAPRTPEGVIGEVLGLLTRHGLQISGTSVFAPPTTSRQSELQQTYAQLVAETSTLMAERDPVGLTEGNPDPVGEYEDAARETVRRTLREADSVVDTARVLREVFDHDYGAGEIAGLESLAREIWRLIEQLR